MPLLNRNRNHTENTSEQYSDGRPLPDEAPTPQPEHHEPRVDDPGLRDLSKRDYLAILRRTVKKFMGDHMTNIAAALAYYAFLAIPAALLVAVGVFSLLAGPNAVTTIVDKLHGVAPAEAQKLIETSLTNVVQHRGTGLTVLVIGGALALWSLTGAMQNLMWALNIAYGREEGRGFVRRRIVGLGMLAFALIGFALAFGVLVLGPHLSTWLGNAVGAESAVKVTWYAAEWPLLLLGLLFVFGGLMFLGPNVEHPRWSFLSLGAVFSLVVWLVASAAFAFFVSHFGSYNKTWGSLAAVVVMLTWLWLSAAALLFGAEMNVEAERSRELRRGEPAEVELQVGAKA